MENPTKGVLYDSPYYCKHCCDGDQHCCDPLQHLQKIDNQKATAPPREMVAF